MAIELSEFSFDRRSLKLNPVMDFIAKVPPGLGSKQDLLESLAKALNFRHFLEITGMLYPIVLMICPGWASAGLRSCMRTSLHCSLMISKPIWRYFRSLCGVGSQTKSMNLPSHSLKERAIK